MDRTGPTSDAHADLGDSAVVDFRLARLETYLDGELDEADAARVREELVSDPDLAAAMTRMAAARQRRVECVGAFEPGDAAAVDRLCAEARKLATRSALAPAESSGRGIWWYGSAAAACVAFGVGFLLGGYDLGIAPADPLANPVPQEHNGMLVSDDNSVDRTTLREQDTTELNYDRDAER